MHSHKVLGGLNMRKVEILAPAGSLESLKGAINGGCDAVYLGGSKFGARAFADNLDEETMLRAIDYVHLYDKKIYLTVNTLLHNEEIEEQLFGYLVKYYKQGLDAVIVQDLGVLSFIHENFPELPIHASTQMTFQSEKGGNFLKKYGVTRFVTARELGLEELKQIRSYTDMEIETFVHGALCYCYSGQCFLSSMIGDRSGNRGRCAQPCRMPYTITEKNGKVRQAAPYVLSPKDMCTLDRIPDLVEAGIDSFKIEGRMKKPAYAAYTAHLYRKYTDLYLEYQEGYGNYLEKHKRELEEDYTRLMDLYNRGGFSKGYFYDYNGRAIMSMERPNHSGVKVGTVSKVQKNWAKINLERDIFAQDVLEFRGKNGRVLYEYTVKEDVPLVSKTTATNTKPISPIQVGDMVYRTRRQELLTKIEQEFLNNQKKITVDMYVSAIVGKPIELTLISGEFSVSVQGDMVEKAKKLPMTEEQITKHIEKLNQTYFTIGECHVYLEGDVFIPVGKLNHLRREGIERLEREICGKQHRKHIPTKVTRELEKTLYEENQATGLIAMVTRIEQAYILKDYPEFTYLYLDMGTMSNEDILVFLGEYQKPVYLVLPSIMRRKDYILYEKAMEKAYKNKGEGSVLSDIFLCPNVEGFVIKNFESYALFQQYAKDSGKKAVLDYNMYTFNQKTKEFWKKNQVEYSTAAIELNGAEWRENGLEGQDVILYGYMPLMTSVQCVEKNTKGCQNIPNQLVLSDKGDRKYYAMNRCKYCYNQLYDSVPLSLHEYFEEILNLSPRNLRLDFVVENEEKTRQVVEFYLKLWKKERSYQCPLKTYTTGHYRKGVR